MKCEKLLSELRLLSKDYWLVINSWTNDYCLPPQKSLEVLPEDQESLLVSRQLF